MHIINGAINFFWYRDEQNQTFTLTVTHSNVYMNLDNIRVTTVYFLGLLTHRSLQNTSDTVSIFSFLVYVNYMWD